MSGHPVGRLGLVAGGPAVGKSTLLASGVLQRQWGMEGARAVHLRDASDLGPGDHLVHVDVLLRLRQLLWGTARRRSAVEAWLRRGGAIPGPVARRAGDVRRAAPFRDIIGSGRVAEACLLVADPAEVDRRLAVRFPDDPDRVRVVRSAYRAADVPGAMRAVARSLDGVGVRWTPVVAEDGEFVAYDPACLDDLLAGRRPRTGRSWWVPAGG